MSGLRRLTSSTQSRELDDVRKIGYLLYKGDNVSKVLPDDSSESYTKVVHECANDHQPMTSQFDTVCRARVRQLTLKSLPTDLDTLPTVTVAAVEVWLVVLDRHGLGSQIVAVSPHVEPSPDTVPVVVVTLPHIERLRS